MLIGFSKCRKEKWISRIIWLLFNTGMSFKTSYVTVNTFTCVGV